MLRGVIAGALALSLGACATITQGSSEDITVNTNPSGANCAINRQDAKIAQIDQTPGTVKIDKTKNDLTIVCDKVGYQQATYMVHSGVEPMTFGNIAIGGLIGWGIDSATGSDNHYDSPVNVTMVPATASSGATPVAGTQ
jgi:hypothetical protein